MDPLPDRSRHHVALMRARRALSHSGSFRYGLGHGGFHPGDFLPTRNGLCDCSGFASWCLALSRNQTKTFGLWISSSHIWSDGLGRRRLFTVLVEPFPGCLVVYPDRGGRQGHVGIVDRLSPLEGIDMAVGGLRRRSFRFFGTCGARYFALREGAVGPSKEV